MQGILSGEDDPNPWVFVGVEGVVCRTHRLLLAPSLSCRVVAEFALVSGCWFVDLTSHGCAGYVRACVVLRTRLYHSLGGFRGGLYFRRARLHSLTLIDSYLC